MNFRMTFLLAAALGVLGLGYLLLRPGLAVAPAGGATQRRPSTPSVARDLVDPKLDNVTKVVCQRKGEEEKWVFEKETESDELGRSGWRMTSPEAMEVVDWEVDQLVRQLGNLQYEIAYEPGAPGGITAAQAGLEPPELTVTLTTASGTSVTVEVGAPVPQSQTYARIAGSDRVVVGKANLRRLVKQTVLEYRDPQLWTFETEQVTRVEIEDRLDPDATTNYRFVRDGARWMIESPITARATGKVDDMLRAMNRLRIVKWVDNRSQRLGTYGLDPAAWTVRVTVEEEIPAEEAESSDEETVSAEASEEESERESDQAEGDSESDTKATPTTKLSVYELHLSERSPIGEDRNTFVRVASEPMVATISKITADKFKPKMSEWRDMQVTTVNVAGATRIDISSPEGEATLVKALGRWTFESDGGHAEDEVVRELLQAVEDLTAVTYVDGQPGGLAPMGLVEPRGRVRFTIPGVEEIERIAVGEYTDPISKRMVYVGRNEVTSIAKVRVADVETILRGPRAYRDRTIVDLHPNRFETLTLTIESPYTVGPLTQTFEREGSEWSMIAPVEAKVRADRVDEFIDRLGSLRAESVTAEDGEPGEFGLDVPQARIRWTFMPVTIEETTSTDEDQEAEEPSPETVELLVTDHDGRFFARRADRRSIYEVTEAFYDSLFAEFRTNEVLQFDDAQVDRFTIRSGDETHTFEHREENWIYQAEPDLPLDSKKVHNLLLQLQDLKTERYVRYAEEDLATYGLSEPAHLVTVTLKDGTSHTVRVSSEQAPLQGKDRGFYAAIDGRPGVFLLTSDTVQRFLVSLPDLEPAS